MLVRFWVENYWCFREKAEIDFTDKRNYCFGKECVRGDFLEKVVILGANGSGKTSFGYALTEITATVGGFTKDIGQNNEDCFINGFGDSDRATFHYEFTRRGSLVAYEYSKTSPSRVASESLAIDGRTVFSYDLDDPASAVFDLRSADLPAMDTSDLDGSEALVRRIGRVARPDRYSPMSVVLDFAEHSLYYRAMWRMDDHIGLIDFDEDVSQYVIENGLVGDLESFLRKECNIQLTIGSSGNELTVRTDTKEIPFFKAVSRGTAIICRLYAWITRCRDREALMFFDDFDDMFDYKTAENLMGYIIQGSTAQCIFVTHNIGLVSSEHLRPDCCFILGDGKVRSLASLTSKTIRKGHNLSKMLREGEFDS